MRYFFKNRDGLTQWIYIKRQYYFFFLPLFWSLVLVIKSLQSMLFSLEYEIINYLILLLKMFKFRKYMSNKMNNSIELSLLNIL